MAATFGWTFVGAVVTSIGYRFPSPDVPPPIPATAWPRPVARALGLEVTRVTLEPHWQRAERLGLCRTRHGDDPNSYWAAAVTGLAGPHAEQKFARYPFGTLAMMWGSAWQQDRRNAAHWLGLIRGGTIAQAEAMARHLVDRDWSAIVRDARALAEEGEISGTELERLTALHFVA
jgi:hypothetical protein